MNDPTPAFTEREIRLIDNCKAYVANDPAGLPGHNLMVIIAKLSDLLAGKAPWITEFNGRWLYSVPTHTAAGAATVDIIQNAETVETIGVAMTREDAIACIEMILNPENHANPP